MKKGLFMKVCLVLAFLWMLGAAVIVVYFHAVNRPLDPTVVAFLFTPGVGELGFSALIKAAKEKADADSAESENADLRAELAAALAAVAEWKAKAQKKKAPGTAAEPEPPANALIEQLRPYVGPALKVLVAGLLNSE